MSNKSSTSQSFQSKRFRTTERILTRQEMFLHIAHGYVEWHGKIERGRLVPRRNASGVPLYRTTRVPEGVILILLQQHDTETSRVPMMRREAIFYCGQAGQNNNISALVLDRMVALARSTGFLSTVLATPRFALRWNELVSNGWAQGHLFKTFHAGEEVPDVTFTAHDRRSWNKMGLHHLPRVFFPTVDRPPVKIWPTPYIDPVTYKMSDLLRRVREYPIFPSEQVKIVFSWSCLGMDEREIPMLKRKVTLRKERKLPPSKRFKKNTTVS